MPIGREVVRADEGLAAAVRAHHAQLPAAAIELDHRVVVVTGHQQMGVEGYQRIGAALVLVPPDRDAAAVPGLDVALGVFHVEQLAVAPQRAFRIVRIGIDGGELLGERRGAGETGKAGREQRQPAPRTQGIAGAGT